MRDDDENFLRDLGWSEIWFPWNKRRIVVRGSDGAFWEKLAVVLSAVALLLSAYAARATWRQTELMQEQMLAGDRNNAVSNTSKKLLEYCQQMSQTPAKPRRVSVDNDAAATPDLVFYSDDIAQVSKSTFLEYKMKLKGARIDAGHSILLLSIWLPEHKQKSLEDLIDGFTSLHDPETSAADEDEDFISYPLLFESAINCYNLNVRLVELALNRKSLLPLAQPRRPEILWQAPPVPSAADNPPTSERR
ncbi:MAG: hypothetical protein DI604_20375 [Delftia acidovorans]|nr:MAG: hypothetical protein DI604_20375 [Delftia acidovorans]